MPPDRCNAGEVPGMWQRHLTSEKVAIIVTFITAFSFEIEINLSPVTVHYLTSFCPPPPWFYSLSLKFFSIELVAWAVSKH